MQKYSTTACASDSEFPQTGAAPHVDPAPGPEIDRSAPAADPLTAASVEESSSGPGADAPPGTSRLSDSAVTSTGLEIDRSAPAAGPLTAASLEEPSSGPGADAQLGTSSNSASAVTFAGPETIDPHSGTANRVVRICGITEIGRDAKTSKITSWKPPFEVQKGLERSFEEIMERAEMVRAPMNAVPVPTRSTPYGISTDELFGRLQKAIAAQACLSERASRLLAYWTLATWFPDALSLAPGLTIVGPAFEGDLVLRTLRDFCRNPLMMTGINAADLKKINWQIPPTLLSYQPNLTRQMAALLGCTTTRGYVVGGAGNFLDLYGAKGLYIGEEAPVGRIPRCSIQVSLQPTAACASQTASRLTSLEVQDLQNMLLQYRLKNLVNVYRSDFVASELASDNRAVANALGACTIDSPGLRSQLISLLAPVEDQRQADRANTIEAVVLEATLTLCRDGREFAYAHEIAAGANRLLEARGEKARLNPERVGHRLKGLGLPTRRLSQTGNGLRFDKATVAQIREFAAVYTVDLMEETPVETENLPSL